MAISLAQTKTSGFSTTSSQTATWGSNTTSGNLIIVLAYGGFAAFATVSSITDSQTNTYTKIDAAGSGAGNTDVELWYAKSITGGTTPTITVNYTGSQDAGFIAREYSGIDTTAPLDQHVFAAGSTTSASSGATATTTQASELVVGWVVGNSNSSGIVVGSGYGNLVTGTGANGQIALEDQIVSATGAQTATFTVGVAINTNTGVATFKAAAISSLTASVSDTITTSESTNRTLIDNINVSDTATTSESQTVAVMPVDLGVLVTPGVQDINGPRIV